MASTPFENKPFILVCTSLAGAETLRFAALSFYRANPFAVKRSSCWITAEAMKTLKQNSYDITILLFSVEGILFFVDMVFLKFFTQGRYDVTL